MNDGYNRVVLFGNLGAAPELRRLASGQQFLRMRLATNHTFLNREGVREDRVEWHSVSLWGPRAEGLSRILHKGSFLLVEGHIRSYSYEKDGQKRWATEVLAQNVVLGGRCGPSGHDGVDDDGRAGDNETARDDAFEAPTMEAAQESGTLATRASRDSEPPARAPRDPEPFDAIDTGRPPRGGQGHGGAAAPPPPAPRKKARASGSAPAIAA
ncbi:MAG: single-stranded DNA-binding protein [Polyangiaceae bacterium]